MMNHVVEEGTGRRAQLDGIKAAGKTGTTNAHRDAWFVGFTGNFICGVWFGNDDYSTMNQMTGGSLPAMTWHEIMAYAHQGIELRPIPGLGGSSGRTVTAEGRKESGSDTPASRLPVLTRRGADALVRVERLMDDATRALISRRASTKTSEQPLPSGQDTVAASDPQTPTSTRGN